MESKDFYSFCIAATMFMLFCNISITVVAMTGVFPIETPAPYENATANETIVEQLGSDFMSFLTGNWLGFIVEIGLGAVGLGAVIFYAITSGSWNVVAAYLFGVFFWGCYQSNLVFLSYGGWLATPLIAVVVTMLTIGMAIMFGGAVIGLFGGK